MKHYTATEAAHELGIDPKRLRSLLRQGDSGFEAPGSGSSWDFTTSDMPKLRKIVEAYNARPKGSKTQRNTAIRDDAGLPIKICRSRARRDRAAVIALSNARVDRLERALIDAGLHISQLDRSDWRTPVAV